MSLTQRDRVLYELRQAGEAGVRSDTFYALSIPRFAARVKELREEGFDIDSDREQQFVRYRLRPSGAQPTPEHDTAPPPPGGVTCPEPPPPAGGSGQLFEVPAERPHPRSAWTDQEAA